MSKTFIVIPNGVQLYKPRSDFLVCDTQDFTFDWCCRNIAGYQFTSIQIWQSNDPEATAYTLTRLRWEGSESLLIAKSVWQAYESLYLDVLGLDKDDFNKLGNSVNITLVEDLK